MSRFVSFAFFISSPLDFPHQSYEDEEKEKIIAEQAAAAQKQSASAPSKPPRFVPDPEDVAELVSVFGFSGMFSWFEIFR